MITKKKYEKPSMKVFPLRRKPQLLQTSGGLPKMPGYDDGGDPLGS